MKPRAALAAPWLAGLVAWRAIAGYKVPPGAFRILLLHDVPPAQHGRLARLLDRLAAQAGFVAPDEALARLAGAPIPADGPSPHAPWLVTFDDGFASNRAVAETLLAARGIRAVFFVCPGLIDLEPEAQRAAVARHIHDGRIAPEALPPGEALMGWDDLDALMRAGHAIGGHTLTHRRLARVRGAALEDEIAGTAKCLAEKLGTAADWFAYPFGDIESIDGDALGVIGRYWRVCRSGVRGMNLRGRHRLALHADHVDLDAAAAWQRLALAGGLDARYAAARRRLAAMAATADVHATP